jgi:hypothetical protein
LNVEVLSKQWRRSPQTEWGQVRLLWLAVSRLIVRNAFNFTVRTALDCYGHQNNNNPEAADCIMLLKMLHT